MLVTKVFEWVERRLEQGQWFRRIYIVLATALTWHAMRWSMQFADVNVGKIDGTQMALIIGAVNSAAAAVQAYAFKNYLDAKG